MSSTKARLVSKQIIVDGSMTGTATVNSDEIDVSGSDKVAIEASWTGSPNGAFTVQGAVRLTTTGASAGAGTNFQNITLSSSPTATGSPGSHLINLADMGFSKIRLQYVNTSGSGTLNAWITVKGE